MKSKLILTLVPIIFCFVTPWLSEVSYPLYAVFGLACGYVMFHAWLVIGTFEKLAKQNKKASK